MALHLVDIERWDPAAITTVLETTIKHTHGNHTASYALSKIIRFLDFGGDIAATAH
ncbi:hypothetical protein [Mycobacterium lepromatosis]|uniref:hypothetical protein n=1 Tax=Mycobacterium lepromatosis TaxID=480418 RepID=UPI0012E00DC4|nr:hypothetical protein [Mycobacterium lepromatosis]UKN41569.1 hypothetical protein MLPF_0244 [Mycobacterium lepromatosis]